MRQLLLIIAAASIGLGVHAQGVNFQKPTSWKALIEQAKAEKKLIFLDFTATWCGPCKSMDAEVFSKKGVGDKFNEHFVSIKVQLDSAKTDDQHTQSWYATAKELGAKYRISVYPTLVYLNTSEEVLFRSEGYKDGNAMVTEADKVIDPKFQLPFLMARYDKGERQAELIIPLVNLAKEAREGTKARKIAQEYINSLPEDSLYSKANMMFVFQNTASLKDRGFEFIRSNVDLINKTVPEFSKENINGNLSWIILQDVVKPLTQYDPDKLDVNAVKGALAKYGDLGEAIWENNKLSLYFDHEIKPFLKTNPKWTAIEKKIKSYKAGKGEEFLFGSVAHMYGSDIARGAEKVYPEGFLNAANYYYQTYPDLLTTETLNNAWAWTMFERVKNKKVLSSALVWSRKAMEINPKSAALVDTYSGLLYKLGRVDEALLWSKKASELNPNDEEIKNNYAKMQKGEITWDVNKQVD